MHKDDQAQSRESSYRRTSTFRYDILWRRQEENGIPSFKTSVDESQKYAGTLKSFN
jgi:hypothetical protein